MSYESRMEEFERLAGIRNFEDLSIVEKGHAAGKLGVGFCVVEVVVHVGEESLGASEGTDEFHGLGEGHVGGVGIMTQGGGDKNFDSGEGFEGFWGDGAYIGKIGEGADAKTEDGLGAMEHFDGQDGDVGDLGKVKGLVGLDGDEFELRNAAAGLRGSEGIGETGFKIGEVVGFSENRDGMAPEKVVGSEIVESGDVVGVGVSEKDSMDIMDGSANGLGAEIGSAIHKDGLVLELDKDGGPKAFVVGIGGEANGAIAAEGGDAHTGARSKHSDSHGGRVLP